MAVAGCGSSAALTTISSSIVAVGRWCWSRCGGLSLLLGSNASLSALADELGVDMGLVVGAGESVRLRDTESVESLLGVVVAVRSGLRRGRVSSAKGPLCFFSYSPAGTTS